MTNRQKNIISAIIATGAGIYFTSLFIMPDKVRSALTGNEGREGSVVIWIAIIISLLIYCFFYGVIKKK